jgi:hypothetical protein
LQLNARSTTEYPEMTRRLRWVHCRCLKSKQYYLARQLLNQEVYFLGDTGLNSADYLLYCYYGANVCIAIKDYRLAFHLLELAITMPTSVGDAIVLAAWQRYRLIYALRNGVLPSSPLSSQVWLRCVLLPFKHGDVPVLNITFRTGVAHIKEPGKFAGEEASYPKHASQGARRDFKEGTVYQALIRHFVSGRAASFNEVLNSQAAVLKEDGVYGLAVQMQQQFAARAVSKLTSTFLTRSLQDVAKEAGLPSGDAAKALLAKYVLIVSPRHAVAGACGCTLGLVITESAAPW